MPTTPAGNQTAMRLVSKGGTDMDPAPPARTEIEDRTLQLGASALTDAEILTLILGEKSTALAEKLLAASGSLKDLLVKEPLDLTGRLGLDPTRASRLLGSVEMGRRAQRARDARPKLRTPREIYNYLAPNMGALRREVFHVLCFNPRNVLLADVRVSTGTANTCPVDAREVFAPAILSGASAIVLAHNHPSGDPEPSAQDLSLTLQLVQAAKTLALKVLDHMVIGDGVYVSLMERGFIGHEDD